MRSILTWIAVGACSLLTSVNGLSCSVAYDAVAGPHPNTVSWTIRMIETSDLILRVTALEYATPPAERNEILVGGFPDSTVRFLVEEVVKGEYEFSDIVLPGYLRQHDNWNADEVPYTSGTGTGGSCYSSWYRQHGQHLLVLKNVANGYSSRWFALGPANEQLRSSDDAWISWVRDAVAR